jgi:50S ribosomal subunit-associated GTPase HflX
VSAFRATLEEVVEADLLLHVVDGSSEQYEKQMIAVVDVLRELGAADKPQIVVFNKCDNITNEHRLEQMKEHYIELKESNAAVKERHEERIAEINEHIETIKLDKRWFRIATCASVVAFVAFCMLEILTPGMGWLRY